jgi:hypothetical protein
MNKTSIALTMILLVGCGGDDSGDEAASDTSSTGTVTEASVTEASMTDASMTDASMTDASVPEARATESGEETSPGDTSGTETGTTDVTTGIDTSSGGVTDPSTGTGTGGGLECAEPSKQCGSFDPQDCTCNGCLETCVPEKGPPSDCVCDVCDQDDFCTNPKSCIDGDGCDLFAEGCQCADCAAHPLCE